MAKPPSSLVETFTAVVPDAPHVQRKQIFGMPAAFAGGNMFAGLLSRR